MSPFYWFVFSPWVVFLPILLAEKQMAQLLLKSLFFQLTRGYLLGIFGSFPCLQLFQLWGYLFGVYGLGHFFFYIDSAI